MIKVSGLKQSQGRIVRETTCPFITVEDGEEHKQEIRIEYFALSIAESAQHRQTMGDDTTWNELLAPLIKSLPDFVDEKDKPVKITKEFLAEFNTLNLQAMFQAITRDLSPKGLPLKPQDGSKKAAG